MLADWQMHQPDVDRLDIPVVAHMLGVEPAEREPPEGGTLAASVPDRPEPEPIPDEPGFAPGNIKPPKWWKGDRAAFNRMQRSAAQQGVHPKQGG